MPSPTVHAAVGLLLAVGLLGTHYTRTAVAVVLLALLVPELDTVAGLVVDGAHRTLLHNFVFTSLAAVALAWDTLREESWLRTRFGPAGVRVAWVALFAHAFAHLLLDAARLEGINVLWPLYDQFFRLDGELYLSTVDGLVQTFVEVGADPETGRRVVDAGGGGTRRETHVASPVQPSPAPEPGPTDRRFPIAVQGWQLFLLLTGLFTVAARKLQSPRPPESDGAGRRR